MSSIEIDISESLSIITNGNSILNGELLSNMGADTVILYNPSINTLYICAHLKDLKENEDENGAFTKQFSSILNIVHANIHMQIIVMMDANTQFEVTSKTIDVFSKDNEISRKRFTLGDNVNVSSIISEYPTSNKMRGAHTAQLNKSFKPVTATIDHILIFNGSKIVDISAYGIDPSGNLFKITNTSTMTTSPNNIADHACVISTTSNGDSFGTLNIKGGDVDDKAWAEFIPQMYIEFFNDPIVKSHVDQILTTIFKGYTIKEIKSKNFLSTPRCGIFDINLSNENIPHVEIKGENMIINYSGVSYMLVKNTENMYISPIVKSEIQEWISILLDDLNLSNNNYERRTFLMAKGYMLLNYWNAIQRDTTELIHGRSLNSIYKEWQELSIRKVSIGKMVKMTKDIYPNLKVISLQEMPKDLTKAKIIIEDIMENVNVNIYMNDTGIGSTRGAIVIFN
jgi:hypothetical protein